MELLDGVFYTKEEVEEIIDQVRKEIEEKNHTEFLIKTYFEKNEYYVNEILKDSEFKRTKNLLSLDYHTRKFIELAEVIGFDRLNEEFVKKLHDNRRVEEE